MRKLSPIPNIHLIYQQLSGIRQAVTHSGFHRYDAYTMPTANPWRSPENALVGSDTGAS